MNNSNTLSEKLKNYSLLAGSILTSSFAVQGQVVYTDIIPDKELGGAIPSSYPLIERDSLDLNNDGLYDFKVTLKLANAISNGFSFYERIDGDFNLSNGIGSHSIEYVPFAFQLNEDDSIPLSNFFVFFHKANFAFQYPSSATYNWQNVHDKYIGLKFKVGSDIHYGWLRLDVNTADTVPNIILKDFAYEETPDLKIAAGDSGFPINVAEIQEAKNQFALFPNPSKGDCIIKFERPQTGELEISVKDVSGKEVFQTNIQMSAQQKELPLNFPNFAPGIYLVQLKSETVSLTEKWIKD